MIANGTGSSEVIVRLWAGSGLGGTQLELSSTDTLTAYVKGEIRRLTKDDGLFDTSYTTIFNLDNLDTEFRVSFYREKVTSALNSIVTLPPPFAISRPLGENFGRNDIVTIEWEPSNTGYFITIGFDFECFDRAGHSYFGATTRGSSDSGIFYLNTSEILDDDIPALDSAGGCNVDVTIDRIKDGQLDPNFGEGGSIKGKQRRVTSFSILGSNV